MSRTYDWSAGSAFRVVLLIFRQTGRGVVVKVWERLSQYRASLLRTNVSGYSWIENVAILQIAMNEALNNSFDNCQDDAWMSLHNIGGPILAQFAY